MIATVLYQVAADHKIGLVRKTNQDYAHAWVSTRGLPTALLIVADGIGGKKHPAGDIASALAITTISDTLMPALSPVSSIFLSIEQLREKLRLAIQRAHTTILNEGNRNPKLTNMGTTVACALIQGTHAVIAHAGDSRVYLHSRGILSQLTSDHSAVSELVQKGLLEPDDLYSHPNRNIITRALGINPQIEIDTKIIDISPGDRLLLCTDGLWEMVFDFRIAHILRTAPTSQIAVDELVTTALDHGGEDNIAVVVCDVLQE